MLDTAKKVHPVKSTPGYKRFSYDKLPEQKSKSQGEAVLGYEF